MTIIETCPVCGHDLIGSVIYTNLPIPKKECTYCGWSWEGQREEVIRVPVNILIDGVNEHTSKFDFDEIQGEE